MRIDHYVIKSISNIYGIEEVNKYLQVPFFYIDNTIDNLLMDLTTSVDPVHLAHPTKIDYVPNWADPEEILGLIPFDTFHVWLEGIGLYSYVECVYDAEDTVYYLKFKCYLDDSVYGVEHGYIKASIGIKPESNKSKVGLFISTLDINGSTIPSSQYSTPIITGFLSSMFRNVEYIFSYFKYVESNDLHMVEKRNTASKRDLKNKKPWTRNDLPTIVYLNKMPYVKQEPQGGVHNTPQSHPRKGHWRRLNNERFKNHPRYKNKIRVKPAWIGNKEEIVNGVIYTLKKQIT